MDASDMELLRYDREGSTAHTDQDTKDTNIRARSLDHASLQAFASPEQRHRSRRRIAWHEIAIYATLCLSVLPVVLLLAYSPKLSRALAYNGCTTNGDFVLPYSSSIWSAKYFFTITIPFSGPQWTSCSSQGGESAASSCDGYSYTQVKVVDLVWDLFIGRGGQLIYAWMGYRVFGAAVAKLMEEGEVGYDLFASVAFHSGSLPALLTLLRNAIGWTPVPRTRKAVWYYVSMACVTSYIVAMPTLLSAMTGYTSMYFPYLLELTTLGGNGTVDCQGAFAPAYGKVVMPNSHSAETFVLSYDHPPESDLSTPWIEYYEQYQNIYAQCSDPLNVTDCPAANITTQIDHPTYVSIDYGCDGPPCDDQKNVTMPAPMPGFLSWPMGKGRAYTHWLCGNSDVFIPWRNGADSQERMKGQLLGTNDEDIFAPICRSGSKYAWGFSYLLSFITAILNLAAASIMCAMWVSVRRVQAEQGTLKDALVMVTQAGRDYGERVGEWNAKTLLAEVENGKVGMTMNQGLRRRRDTIGEYERQDKHGQSSSGNLGGKVER
ncbi:hypothetical protein LTR56_018002 [Elasticomyces elasticus]|nr:hypothetical protein LTR56_018002 [Elasticomyces elasticus]KAK3663337.1 hypothetical protein LTR22_005744 [Elasticomyces elasticus]KAK4925416.1 hypothetical protein LTR49_007480 [Elasticomyces elasticus]KAK5764511.1 hypothetical protein LTS12_005241 [Elasticomyces elasticus]